MPRLSLGLGAQNIRKVGGGGAAPTTLPLSTPNLYFSGLTFGTNNPDFRYIQFKNPYNRQSDTSWYDLMQGNEGVFVFTGTSWILYAAGEVFNPDDGWLPASVQVAFIVNNGLSIPLAGWTNGGGSVSVTGTLVISTTP